VLSKDSTVAKNAVLGIAIGTILDGLIPGFVRVKQPISCQDGGLWDGPASNPMRDTERDSVSAATSIG